MPVRRISSAQAFATLKANPNSGWPRRDDPDNRFADFADPSFKPRFMLEPGQRIFTIGSCFARGVERALAERGFDVPTIAYQVDRQEWDGDPTAVLNNYVPQAIAPQIRWAFGMEKFDIDRHGVAMGHSRVVDLQLPNGFRPAPRDLVERRREIISEIYRSLSTSHVVIVTLGLIEAWFDTFSGLYINRTPPKQGKDPSRFELHVLDYNDIVAALEELVGLLDQVCPRDYRLILTVSPVPLTATFTEADVAVANSYSKSVLRAAVEPFVAARPNVEYFPSYESVLLTERALAFGDDQIHVTLGMVRFNVDRMIRRYTKSDKEQTVEDVIAQAREDRQMHLPRAAVRRLQEAWALHPDEPRLVVALADALLRRGDGRAAETLLRSHLEKHETIGARALLARYYNNCGRHEEAALECDKASRQGRMRLQISLERAIACYHLARFEEGLAVLNAVRHANEHRPMVVYWKARLCEKLARPAEAEELYRSVNTLVDETFMKVSFAEFLAAEGRWQEVAPLVEHILLKAPSDAAALRLRAELQHRGLRANDDGVPERRIGDRLRHAMQRCHALVARAVGAPPPGAAARTAAFGEDQ